MDKARKRRYRKRKRALAEERTRLAITEAVMDLHRLVGPARTSVTEVARRAGVTRMTVYKHFPTEADLIVACATHWASLNPFPDPALWMSIADPDKRLAHALAKLYAWYRRTEDMMGNVLRDAPLMPALEALMKERWWAYLERLVDTLMADRDVAARRLRPVRAALRLALDFNTWRSLTRSGMSTAAAARFAASIPSIAAGDLIAPPDRQSRRRSAAPPANPG